MNKTVFNHHERKRLALEACRLFLKAEAIEPDGDIPLKERLYVEAINLAQTATGMTVIELQKGAEL